MQKAEARACLEKKAQVNQKKLHQGKIFSLVEEKILYPDSHEKKFDLILHPGAVAMIPIDDRGHLILVQQWRRAARQILLELPAGTLELDEEPIDCVQRELQEEIGYEARKITSLGGFYTAPGFCNEYIYLFLATDLHSNPLIGDDAEEIDIVTLSLDEAMTYIEEGKIIDAKTIAGIYRYKISS